ncbi:gamma-glutamyltransferase family protein [Vibrio metoecus]|uniref:gamma-glutamyltransferase family protein n=1 Tax=Vibrio metoecus TaxID=1481663 RepID=UPI00215D1885|nr:gamma-glutamyltransferase family protein [Vibrio metoecus]MCR9387708.1 gamma-glutamyltransferase family protein [Vibrio metoecus]
MANVAFTAPHFKASDVGLKILRQGGTACEAMVAAAAMIAVQYPHMNSIGGDGFWLIAPKNKPPISIDACGASAHNLSLSDYCSSAGLPQQGGAAALTMAGTLSGWQMALEQSSSGISLDDLLRPAILAAEEGIRVTPSLAAASQKTWERLAELDDFAHVYLKSNRQPLAIGDIVTQIALAATLSHLAKDGLESFYRGDLAKQIAQELNSAGSPLKLADFSQHRAQMGAPLTCRISHGQLYNLGAPTQGLASLLILGMYDRLVHQATSVADHVHILIEATKIAFDVRNHAITDEKGLPTALQEYLACSEIDALTKKIQLHQATHWPKDTQAGDTVWMGAVDQYGTMVSFIQSIYWEFGCGVLLPSSGILWNIRSQSFSLDPKNRNCLAPNKKPFHTLNPAYAQLNDGRRMVYGTMGGDGQPQTQACLMSRYLYQDLTLQESIAKPRWLLGRTWGDSSTQLRMETSLADELNPILSSRGHTIHSVSEKNEMMGHAGAIVLHPAGEVDVATDPRSDGAGLQASIE